MTAHEHLAQHMGCYMATRPRRASWKRLQPLCSRHKLQTAEMAIISSNTTGCLLVLTGFETISKECSDAEFIPWCAAFNMSFTGLRCTSCFLYHRLLPMPSLQGWAHTPCLSPILWPGHPDYGLSNKPSRPAANRPADSQPFNPTSSPNLSELPPDFLLRPSQLISGWCVALTA